MEPNELPDFLAGIRHMDTYKVPPQYFDTLTENILGKVHMPPVSQTPLSEPPVGYFDGLAGSILQRIKSTQNSEAQQELKEIDSFLAGVPKTNPYNVPQGYFETFLVPVETKEQEAPVIRMSRRPTRWVTYAAAAVAAGVIATGAILFAGKADSTLPSADYKAALAKISDNALTDFLDNSAPDADAAPVSNEGNLSSDGLYHQLLNNVSDNDIQQYLNENNDSNEKTTTGI